MKCYRLQTASRRFSRGFDGVPRGCASQSEKRIIHAKLADTVIYDPNRRSRRVPGCRRSINRGAAGQQPTATLQTETDFPVLLDLVPAQPLGARHEIGLAGEAYQSLQLCPEIVAPLHHEVEAFAEQRDKA